MKKILTSFCFFFISLIAFSQTDGITYQAVIIDPEALQLPGVDSEGNYLVEEAIAIRFTIYDENNQLEFQEIQTTTTDAFGRINLLIGEGNHDYFKDINWDGTPKDLQVEIDFDAGSNFEFMSREALTFLPFAYHRNITATGTLTVDDRTFLNGELEVEGPTTLESTLDVINQNATNLTGSLTVGGETNINAALNVNGNNPTDLSGDLTVSGQNSTSLTGDLTVGINTQLTGNLDVSGDTTLEGLTVNGEASFGDLSANELTINQSTTLNGTTLINGLGSQIRITSDLPNVDTAGAAEIGNHPLLIDGGNNGLAIKVNGSRNNNTNFITFYDDLGSWGRIEGETPDEFENNADYLFDQSSLDFDIYDSDVDLGFAIANQVIAGAQTIKAASDFRGCIGLGGCIASPGPADIAFAALELVSATAQAVFASFVQDRSEENKLTYDINKYNNRGVTYASGAGDYAEYLQRKDVNETMKFGDVVGLNGGQISKNTANAERVMVVSFKPIVLGNMPPEEREHEYEKVAFMGQIPVKTLGKVNIGDYIVPSGKNDGSAIAVSPSKITIKDINKIIGVAWSTSDSLFGFNMINVAVGLNRNDNNFIVERLNDKVQKQATEISELKNQISEIHEMILKLQHGDLPNAVAGDDTNSELVINNYYDRNYETVHAEHGDIVYWEITRKDIEAGFALAKKQMMLNGVDVNNHFLWKKMESDIKFKNELIAKIESNLEKQLHFHKTEQTTERH